MKTAIAPQIAIRRPDELNWNHYGSILVPFDREINMPVNFTLKNIPEPLYNRLRMSAEANRRSLNMEAITLLEQALIPSRIISVEERIARAKALRQALGNFTTTEEEISAFKNEGRK